jgi:hypothetical protein
VRQRCDYPPDALVTLMARGAKLPSLFWVPAKLTVSPGRIEETLAAIVFVTAAVPDVFTSTVFPLESVT